MSNFISRLLKGTAGISQNNSFECQSFVEVNPTVNRQSTDSHSQGHYTLASRITRYVTRLAALFVLLFTLGIGKMWAKVVYYNDGGQAGTPKVHFWGGTSPTSPEWDSDPEMANISGDIYAYDIGDHTHCKFRYNNASQSTDDLDVPSDAKNYYNSGWFELNSYAVGKTLYLKVNSNWKEGSARFAACFCGVAGQTWVNCSQVGSSDYYSVTVPEGEWPMVIFVRLDAGKEGNKWENKWDQTDDLFYEYDKNLCTITGWSNSQTRGQYAPNGAIHGSMNSWVMMSFNPFNGNGELTLELGANTAYEFQVISDESWYGFGNANFKHSLVGQTEETTLSTGGKDILILTADAGEYTFNWDKSSHELSVTYPNLPNSTNLNPNYVYVKNTSNWSPVNAHLWGGTNATVWENDPALSSINFNSTTYYYAATGYESSIIFGQGVNDEHKTGDLTISEGKGKYYDPSTTSWKWFSSRITLNNQSATSAGTEYKDAELFNTALTTKITCPTKTGYTFGGYFTATGGGGVQIIEDDGDWIASVSGYTNSSTQWVRANTELFAKWTPITYSIRYNTNGGDGGSMDNSSHTYDVAKALTLNGFTKTGYSFAGWATSAGGSVAYSNGQSVSNLSSTDGATVDLFAKWTPNPYTISLNNHDATSAGTSSVNVTFDANTNLTSAITIPKKTGYGFHGYYTEESGAGTQIIDAEGNFIAGAGSNTYLDGSKNWKYANNIPLHAYWVASAVTTPTVTASMPAYIGEDVTITLSATSTNVAEPVVIFFVADNSNSTTYEVVATPGAKGSMPTYSTTHTATFTAKHAATYTVTAKVYSGKLIDNFDGSLAHWKGVDGGTFVADETNPAMQAGNGSNTVMKITRGNDVYKTVQTKQAADNSATTDWNLDYGFIYMSMYSTTARSTKMKYSDNYSTAAEVTSSDISASTWTRVKFTVGSGHQVDYILPFMLADGTMYIDDIILSNESSMTAQATSSSASTTITQPTIGSCTATAATTNWGGSGINISLSAQTTYLADAVVVFFVTDGSNSTTYEVTATPGTPGANNAITHTATFVAQHAATYSVTAKLYNGKFIDNFEGSASAWSGLGYGTCERVSNVEREADNGSTKVMKITRSVEDGHGEARETAWTTTAENSGTKTSWGHEYGYIHMRYYAPQAETPEVEYWDDGVSVFKNTTLSSQTASTWHELVFAVDGGVVNYIHPFVLSGGKTDGHYIYIDDIILSNRSTWAPIHNTSGEDLTASASNVTIRDTYTVTLDNREATSAGTESVSVQYGTTTGMTAITNPTKNHYDFGGYWTSSNSGSTLTTQLIDENGNWIKNVTDYTGASGDDATWLYADDITLYAKWTEKSHSVTVAVSAGAYEGTPGTVQISSADVTEVTAGEVTWSAVMTPIANPGWKFKEWQKTSNVDFDLETYHSDYQSSTDNSMRIKASADDQTLTAVFEPRYYLVGKIWDDSADGGMPGWENYNKPFKVVTTSPVLDTCKVTLTTNTSFYIEVRDKADGFSYGKSDGTLGDNTTLTFTDKDNKVFVYSNGGTEYTFKITAIDGNGRPTVSVERPHQLHIGHKRVDIDGSDHSDNSGGTLTAAIGGSAIANNEWFNYGSNIAYTASAQTGYTLKWYTNSDYSSEFDPQPGTTWTNYTVTSDENVYAKFAEKSTAVSLENDGHGKVQIGGDDKISTTCGVTTTRELTAVPNTGYAFRDWSKPSGDDIDFNTSTNPTTLTGLGAGLSEGQRVYASFDAKTYSVKLNNDHEGSASDDGSATATYDATSLSSITHAQFSGWTLLGYWNSSAIQVANADGSLIANVDGYTGAGGKWINDAGETVNIWAHWSRSVSLDREDGTTGATSMTVTYKSSTLGSYSAPTKTGYSFGGYYTGDDGTGTQVINSSGVLQSNVTGYTNSSGQWTKEDATTLYAKWTPATLTFTGATDSDWDKASNWSPACVPTIDHDVVIQAPVVVNVTSARAKSVAIYNDGSTHTGQLEIAAGKELVVATTVRKTTDGSTPIATAEEDIVFDSSSSLGLGALVMGEHNGTNQATVNFYSKSHGSTGSSASVNQYIGTPFNDATVLSDWYNSWMYEIDYDNSAGNIFWKRINGNTALNPFQGYCVISADNEMNPGHMYWMQGQLVASGEKTVDLELRGDAGAKTFSPNNENMLANSWMAPIKINAFDIDDTDGETDFTNTEATIYIFNSCSLSEWNNTGGEDKDKFVGNYSAYTVGTAEGAVIPAMQAFSVFPYGTMGEDTRSIKLNYKRLVYDPAVDAENPTTPAANRAPQRRVLGEETDKMHLYVHGESGYGDMVYLLSRSDFENGFENGWDGHKLFGESVAPQMYAITPDGNMAINCVPTMEGTVLGFQKGSGDSEYAFSFDYEGLETLYLNDLKAQVSTLIDATNIYTFTAAANDDEARFIISATPIGQMPTGITVSGERLEVSGSKKLLINDHVYIIRGGRMYSIDGCLVK